MLCTIFSEFGGGVDWRVWSRRVSAKLVCRKIWPGPESSMSSRNWWYLRRATVKLTLKWWVLMFWCRSFNGDVVDYLLWDLFGWHHHAVITKHHNILLRTCSTPSTDAREAAIARFRYLSAGSSFFFFFFKKKLQYSAGEWEVIRVLNQAIEKWLDKVGFEGHVCRDWLHFKVQ